MPAKEDQPLTVEERPRRVPERVSEAGTSDESAAFDRALEKAVTPEQNGLRTETAEKPAKH